MCGPPSCAEIRRASTNAFARHVFESMCHKYLTKTSGAWIFGNNESQGKCHDRLRGMSVSLCRSGEQACPAAGPELELQPFSTPVLTSPFSRQDSSPFVEKAKDGDTAVISRLLRLRPTAIRSDHRSHDACFHRSTTPESFGGAVRPRGDGAASGIESASSCLLPSICVVSDAFVAERRDSLQNKIENLTCL